MCTALMLKTLSTYFGRNLDLEYSCGESVTVAPQNFPFFFRKTPPQNKHYAIIGTAFVAENYPLFYDGMNEHGLFAAALNFSENAVYMPKKEDFENLAPFEFIPKILGGCKNADEAKDLLEHANITSTDFCEELPATPLHWFVADKNKAFAVEPTAAGIKIYEDLPGVLTNEPPFDFHKTNLRNYLSITSAEPSSTFSENLKLTPYSRGMGALGLPGDSSSASRFVKAAFTKENSVCGTSEEESVTQFFHILGSVEMVNGCVKPGGKTFEKTVYSSCVSAESGVYYYKTYENSRITAIDMKKEDLGGKTLISYPFLQKQDIFYQNRAL